MEAKSQPFRKKTKSLTFSKRKPWPNLLITKPEAQLSRLGGFGSCFYTCKAGTANVAVRFEVTLVE
jgi:hypothetical protein